MLLPIKRSGISDLLTEKNLQITNLIKESEASIQSILNRIAGLNNLNQELDDAIAEMEAYASSLSAVKDSMIQLRNCNSTTISAIYDALNLEEEAKNSPL